ncbi:MAG: LD-carboxypeptidase [Candidatus Marinimicrobia bacterium]|nr:LD-carboxypeptidase [Candidatus Neomarinimicrobiota bacterium]
MTKRVGRLMIIPEPIQPGATIAVISPASAPKPEKLKRGIEYLRSQGFKIREGANLWGKNKYLSGQGPEQLADLHQAFADDEVDMIMCSRGGYGTPRYLDDLDYELIAQHPKFLVGYSDITALQCALGVETGLVTISGAMVAVEMAAEDGIDSFTETSFWDLLTKPFSGQVLQNPADIPFETMSAGSGTGPLVGGCLSLFNNLMGTPYFPDVAGGIMVLEDIGENVQHLDRMLSQFKMAGFFHGEDRVNGLLLGQFIDTWKTADEDDFSLDELIRDIIGEVDFPIISNFAYGHNMRKLSLPLGATVKLDGATGSLTLI